MFLAADSLFWIIPCLFTIFGAFLFARSRRKKTLAQLPGLQSNASPLRQRFVTVAILTSLVLAGLTLTRPYGGTILSEHRKPAKNIVILLDVSKSMGAIDAENLTRLEAAKLYAHEFIDKRPIDRIGLLSFSGATFPECPTTLDRTMLLQRLDILKPGSIPVGGTNFTDALKEADKLLTNSPPPGSAILILSDGDNSTNDPIEITKTLAQKEIPIFTFSFGDLTREAPIPNSPLRTLASNTLLKEIATLTRGGFFQGKPTELESTVAKLSARIDAIELLGDDIAPEIFNRPLELYAYPLTAALILLLLHILLPIRTKKWHPLAAIITLSFFMTNPLPAQATENDSQALDEKLSGFTDAKSQSAEENLPLVLHFTGSDWSQLSITFDREILSHPVYQKWERAKVVSRTIDLPRAQISDERRRAHRTLAKKFLIQSYPTSVFLQPGSEEVLGRLTHDTAGPASWIRRANAILGGDESESDSPASIEHLPQHTLRNLNEESLTPDQRSVLLYNKAIEFERANPELHYTSPDRLKLLLDLYDEAAAEASDERPDLRFNALHKSATLLHTTARKSVPDWDQEEMTEAQTNALQKALSRGGPEKLAERAIARYEDAIAFYCQAAPLSPNHAQLPVNLAAAYRDLERAKKYLAYFKAYQKAVKTTSEALTQETRFRRSLDREVTTSQEINRKMIEQSLDAIVELVDIAETIQDKPTVLDPEKLSEYRLAKEDIILAPSPHNTRDLHPSTQHIKNALEHLIDPNQLSRPENPGNGEGSDKPQGDIPKGGPEDLEKQGPGGNDEKDYGADLRRSQKEQGNIRERLLRRLGESRKRVPRAKDK